MRLIQVLGLAAALALLSGATALAVPSARAVVMKQLPPTWSIALSAWRHGVRVDHDLAVTMPDGVRLTASLYRPKDAAGPLPTVLVRLPYHRLRYTEGFNAGLYFARHGYAVMVQDLRGTGDSQGELLPWRDVAEDGAVTLDWIARQPWSTGRIGTFGCSGLGETQMVLGKLNHPTHRAIIASGAGGGVGSALGRGSYFGVYEGGVFQLASAFGWFADTGTKRPNAPPAKPFDTAAHLRDLPVSALVSQVRPAPNGYDDFVSTPLDDPQWARWGYLSDADRIDVPSLIINTWGDQTVGDALAWAEHMRRTHGAAGEALQKVVISAGNHCQHEETGTATERFGELELRDAARPWKEWYLKWFDHWLAQRGNGLDDFPAYSYFMLMENRWYGASQWPPAEAQLQRWALGSDGRANAVGGNGRMATQPAHGADFDGYRYDPMNPVPSRGGPVCCTGDLHAKAGPVDQAEVESRDDVLVYTSAPVATDLRIAGPLRLHLSFSSNAPDTDIVARLTHVRPDGLSTNIQEGALRLSHRDGLSIAAPLRTDETYAVDVDMRSIAYMIPKGHRLRLQVTSSSFPRLERHLNGPGRNADATVARIALNRVHYGASGDASYLVLPVLAGTP